MLYFDSAATTAVYPELNRVIERLNSEAFYNPSALYAPAFAAREQVETARASVAKLLGALPEEIYFTSCATESNNWALRMGALNPARAHIVITAGEHAAVRETARALEQRGAKLTVIPLLVNGRVDEEKLFAALDDTVTLVSVIHVSNETGAINDVERIAREIKEEFPRIVVHSDGVQAFGKFPINVKQLDSYSISAHKIHAPKGVGALYLNKKCRLLPLLCGGNQERGGRSGTENVSGIAAFGQAAARYAREYDAAYLEKLKQKFLASLGRNENFFVNGADGAYASPHVLSCGFFGIRGETLMHALCEKGFVIGMGSACSSHSAGNSVLGAMGLDGARILYSVRVSFDMSNTEQDADALCRAMEETANELKGKIL